MARRYFTKRLDWPLAIASALLLGVGLLILFAINFRDPALAQGFNPWRQVFHALVGMTLLVAVARTDYRLWFRLGRYWYVIGLGLLMLVFLFGKTVQGATRAIDLGLLQFQPAEFIKLGIIFILAWLFASRYEHLKQLRYLLASMVLVAVPAVLIMLQPDLGSSLVIGFIWVVMILVSNANKVHVAIIIGLVVALTPIVLAQLKPYQRERLQTFLNPGQDPQGAGYNVLQSTIAVGSGRWFGKGLGSGTQSQLNFLPSQQTDFVFAVLAEKMGFFGAILTLALFATLLSRGVIIAWRAHDRFGMAVASGITALFLFHVLINIGMNLGIVPVTGIPLPLLSYGGTNLIISLVAIGLLESIAIYRKDLEFGK